MEKPFRDRWRDRLQLEIGLGWRLMPDDSVSSSWRRHLFDPFGSFVLVGDVLTNPRTQLPEFGRGFVDDVSDGARDPETNMLKPILVSRCLWIAGGLRLLGLELGVGIFYRKRFSFDAAA